MNEGLRVALVHDWLTGVRGGERVLARLARRFPDATVYTLFAAPEAAEQVVPGHRLVTSWLQRVPGSCERYRSMLPLFPSAIESIRIEPCDLVISTSHCVAKSAVAPEGAYHLCYCLTPMRYVWSVRDDYFHARQWEAVIARPLLEMLKHWDKRTADRPHRFVAISRYIAERIRASYGVEADVVYPPVDTEFYRPDADPVVSDRCLVVSALVPYKRVDLAVEAFNRGEQPLDIIGSGSEERQLRAKAGPTIRFHGWLPDDEVRAAYRRCRALVFPGEEDFGLVPLEAQACGRPVVAYGKGGVLETVREGKTGVLYRSRSPHGLTAAVKKASETAWNTASIRRWAERFGADRFDREFEVLVQARSSPA